MAAVPLWLRENLSAFQASELSLVEYLNRLRKKDGKPYSGNSKYYMYKSMLAVLGPSERTLYVNASHLFDRKRQPAPSVNDLQQLLRVVRYCYLDSMAQEPTSTTYVKFAVIILTSTNVRFKCLHHITNRVWRQFDQTLMVTFPKQKMTVTADQFLYELAKQLVPIDPSYPPDNSVVPVSYSSLNRAFKALYLQINYDHPVVKSLGMNRLKHINKHALYEMLKKEGRAILSGLGHTPPRLHQVDQDVLEQEQQVQALLTSAPVPQTEPQYVGIPSPATGGQSVYSVY